ncbi:MAG TPA: hypothetical protein VKB87_04165 [Myxococcaceae bacterium]|nr:hypothetical protein [Myxococcaceae bacterium]
MGIDWFRVQVKQAANHPELGRLIEQQAIAFQSIWTWNFNSWIDRVPFDLCHRLHLETYQAASEALRHLLEFPEWNDGRMDVPDLSTCWRVYPITHNAIFPPLWRLRAHRTFLPDQLEAQLPEWKDWAGQVANGGHEEYVRELHLYVTSDFMRHHWSSLRAAAIASHCRTGSWTTKPTLVEVRERIVRLPEPTVSRVRIEPSERPSLRQDEFEAQYAAAFEGVKTLIELTRAWDSNVRGNEKLQYYEDYYRLTLDEFRHHARDSWLQEFFEWAIRCVQRGFGLYLDY